MARKKQYNEAEVIEKAMYLFWRNGYENTSVRMLEKEMGINQFSIYASFGNKHGVFVASLKEYRKRNAVIFNKLKASNKGLEDIKQFFYDSIQKTNDLDYKGCLVTNTYNEFIESEDEEIKNQMIDFMASLKAIFIEKLKIDSTKNEETVLKQANYLLLAKHGLAAAARVNTKQEIEDYIEMTFKNI
ncbi:TetR/AcrR family transcriptional regulator [Lutibacter holmesii]|uniref:TetR/AcrR family transcriptional regulator n=1 Tax=Lutibacter holmesii TaxID=1137985 RepID=A0ABW3WMF6_9FLAO